MIFAFKGFIPVVDSSSFVHPQATVTGNVVIGKDVYIGPHACLRGDWGGIEIHDGCNVQENCTIHMFPGKTVVLEPGAHIGHGAVIHGARIGRNSMVGMNSVVMDDVTIGAECIVGALAFVKAGTTVPDRSLLVGNPARIIKQVSDDMITWKTKGTTLYQSLPATMQSEWEEVEPLTEMPADRPSQETLYATWQNIKNQS
jgi:phenylacetic acid degradation protein/carnitine operon protein CaiE